MDYGQWIVSVFILLLFPFFFIPTNLSLVGKLLKLTKMNSTILVYRNDAIKLP